MAASRQVEIPFSKCIGRQRGWGFGALAQVTGRTAIPFLRKYIVPLQNAYVLICWRLLRQKLQRLLVLERISRQLQNIWQNKLRENSGIVVAGKGLQAESFQQKLQTKLIGHEETFSQTFLIIVVEQFPVPTFCGCFWKSWSESPSN